MSLLPLKLNPMVSDSFIFDRVVGFWNSPIETDNADHVLVC